MIRKRMPPLLRATICLVLCGCLVGLAGCVHTAKTVFVQHYTLGGSTSAPQPKHHAAHPYAKTLQIARINVPPWLAGTAMYYRLNYRNGTRLAAYGKSDWVAPPATLLEPILQHAITTAGDWSAVLGPRTPASADASLHIRLDDFSQAFSEPHDSAGVIDASATLVNNHDGNVIAQRHFHVTVAASSPDAQGGVKGLAKASMQLAAHLQSWLHTVSSQATVTRQPQNGR